MSGTRAIYVIGSSNTDMVVACERLPVPGETVLGGEFLCAHGGKGANQAVAAARLGGRVTLLCKVGGDANGRASVEAYRREGIDTSAIRTDLQGVSGVALIVVDRQGENIIAVAPGTNAALTPHDTEGIWPRFQAGDLLLLQLEIPLETVEYAAQQAHERGGVVILDPAPAPAGGLPDPLLGRLDYLLPNEHEAAALVGREMEAEAMARTLAARGVKHVILTMGEKGCLLAAGGETEAFAAHPVEAVDSTAAGDAFAGALAVGLAEKMKIREAIDFAQRAAAWSVTRKGAQPSLPTRQELEMFSS